MQIKYKGNQVPPAEVEAVLLAHPLVTDAGVSTLMRSHHQSCWANSYQVCGVYDSNMATEVPVGYVSFASSVRSNDQEEILERVKQFVHERVAPHKRLRGGLYYLAEMPKNATGKSSTQPPSSATSCSPMTVT